MLNISYNLSWRLKDTLGKIENLRVLIALCPISPKTKLKLRWDAMLNRIYYSARLSGNPLERTDVIRLLGKSQPKKMRDAFDYLLENWLGENKPVRSEDLITLHAIIGSGKLSKQRQELQNLLDYLQARQENPIIQSAIANIELSKMQPFKDNNLAFSLLVPYLFLYKSGYDFRRFVSFETEFGQDRNFYKQTYSLSINASTLTLWLEYFAKCILTQLDKIYQSITTSTLILKEMAQSYFELNDRQKSILNMLDLPQGSITNRKIQKNFKISQITASRDLAKLTLLGFLFSHGKGRSVYYTRV